TRRPDGSLARVTSTLFGWTMIDVLDSSPLESVAESVMRYATLGEVSTSRAATNEPLGSTVAGMTGWKWGLPSLWKKSTVHVIAARKLPSSASVAVPAKPIVSPALYLTLEAGAVK